MLKIIPSLRVGILAPLLLRFLLPLPLPLHHMLTLRLVYFPGLPNYSILVRGFTKVYTLGLFYEGGCF